MMVNMKDWVKWHKHYDTADSSLKQRLALVQYAVRQSLPRQRTAYTILDICAGDGRDLIEVLGDYEHKDSLRGLLVEIDPQLVDETQRRAQAADMPHNLKIIQGDASQTHMYKDSIPADLILLCGVFGNISDDDVAKTIQTLPQLCKPGARVIWTRHRRSPDRTDEIRNLFHTNGFDETNFASTDNTTYGVGVHTFNAVVPAMGDNVTMFSFLK